MSHPGHGDLSGELELPIVTQVGSPQEPLGQLKISKESQIHVKSQELSSENVREKGKTINKMKLTV